MCLIAALAFSAQGQTHGHGTSPHWSYSGKGGPAHWWELDPRFAACKSGTFETPIDIQQSVPADLPELRFDYRPSPLTIVDNGHTVLVNYAPGSTLSVGDRKYELKQFHFHHPSEERIHHRRWEMVVHFVHQDTQGRLAVVAVLLTAGKRHPLIDVLWRNLPAEKEKPEAPPDTSVQAHDLLPSKLGYYAFPGSLTTPPCTEGVQWFVLKTPVELSAAQIGRFAKLYPNNARPLQPLHGRRVMETREDRQ